MGIAKATSLALVLASSGISTRALAQDPSKPLPEDRAAGAAAIDPEQIRSWLTVLTSEEFGGRGTGQKGFQLAAEYVAAHFEKLGLEPKGDDGSFLQRVPWKRRTPDLEKTRLSITVGGEEIFVARATDGGLRGSASESQENSGPLTLLIARPGDSGLEGMDLEGRQVIVLAEESFASDQSPRGRFRAMRDLNTLANEVGKAGGTVIAFADSGMHPINPAISETTGPGGGSARAERGRRRRPSQFTVDADALVDALAKAGVKMDAKPAIAVDGTAQLTVVIEEGDAPAFNVVGYLPGGDPAMANEYVGIGCHLDHLGRRGDVYYPGADDDGSGTVGLMAIAAAFAKNPNPPRRGILFMAFCGEERGLIGSRFLAGNPPMPLEGMVAELQVDMIGRNEEFQARRGNPAESADDNTNSVHLVGTEKLSKDLHELCLRLNKQRAGFEFEFDEEDVYSRSDHFNFAREGVPIAFLFTGFHPDYHQASDTVEKINFPKLARIARYVYDLGFELATQDGRPQVDPELWSGVPNKAREEPVAPMRKR